MRISPQANSPASLRQDLSSTSLKTIFLDRDGVINRKMPEGQYVTAWHHFDLLPGVAQSIARLNQAGLRVIVVTNQRGITLGLYSSEDVVHIHRQLQLFLHSVGSRIDAFYFCPHDKHQCNCRKPLPGLFEKAQRDFLGLTAETSLIIGDSLSDIEFGYNLGMRTIFLDGDKQHQKPGANQAAELAVQVCRDLADAVAHILGQESPNASELLLG